MSKRVIQLLRVSTERQAADDKAGLPAQRAINQRTAVTYGLEIVRTIEMSDVSGTAVLRAPEMQELLRLIESPDIHGVIIEGVFSADAPRKLQGLRASTGFCRQSYSAVS